jgi:CubicO group peptidase (beta-lactamase class C family)
MQALFDQLGPDSVALRSGTLGGAFPELVTEDGGFNTRIVRAAEIPGANMVSDARSLARLYAATIGEVDGARLLRQETVDAMTVPQTTGAEPWEAVPGFVSEFSLGFMTPRAIEPMMGTPLLGPRSFGHPGAGGSLGFANPDAGIAFGYVMNRMANAIPDPRLAGLLAATAECL